MHHCSTITISQLKGGSGKTTIAANLAIALSLKNKRVALIDIDPQGSLSYWYDIRQKARDERLSKITFVAKVGWKIQNEILSLKVNHDYIIIDSPPHNETDTKTAIRVSDLVIIPVQPSPTDLWATSNTILSCKENKIPFQILLNRVNFNSKLLYDITANLENILQAKIGNRIAFSTSFLNGKSVLETCSGSPAAKETNEFTNEIISILSKLKS